MEMTMPAFINLLGQRFGRLIAQKRLPSDSNKKVLWECLCDCGKMTVTGAALLRNGKTQSCGCLQREMTSAASIRHGDASRAKGEAPEYRSWLAMLSRCGNPNVTGYENYGGRGITVCQRWRDSYEAFLADMGRKPSLSLSIDRIDVDGDYEPDNCRWATAKEQANNTRRHKAQRIAMGL